MSELTLNVPQPVMDRLEQMAAKLHKTVEEVVLEQVALCTEATTGGLQERYEQFVKDSGLFVEFSTQETCGHRLPSEDRQKQLAAKLGRAGPLSAVILEERGES